MPSESNASCSATNESRIRDFVNGLLSACTLACPPMMRSSRLMTMGSAKELKALDEIVQVLLGNAARVLLVGRQFGACGSQSSISA
jgi:hypothetical protein